MRKLGKQRIIAADIPGYCHIVLNPVQAMALRLKASLLLGIARIHSLQWKYLFQDVDRFRSRFSERLRGASTANQRIEATISGQNAVPILCDMASNNFLPEVILSPFASLLNENRQIERFSENLLETIRKRDSLSSRNSLVSNSLEQFQSFGFSDDIGDGFDELVQSSLNVESTAANQFAPFQLSINPISVESRKRKRHSVGLIFDESIELTVAHYEEQQADLQIQAQSRHERKEQKEHLTILKKETIDSLLRPFTKTPKSRRPSSLQESSEGFGDFANFSSELDGFRNSFEFGRNANKNNKEYPTTPISIHRWSSPMSLSYVRRQSVDRWSSPSEDAPRREIPSVSPVKFVADNTLLNEFISQSSHNHVYFDHLVSPSSTKADIAATFLELLHLSHGNIIRAEQIKPYGRITMKLKIKDK